MNNWVLYSLVIILALSHWCLVEPVARVRWHNLRIARPQSFVRSRNVFPNSRRFNPIRSQRPGRHRIGRPRARLHPIMRRRSVRPRRRPWRRPQTVGTTRRIMTRMRPKPRKLFGQSFPSTNGLLKEIHQHEIPQLGPPIRSSPIRRPFVEEPKRDQNIEYDHYNYDIDLNKNYNQDYSFEEEKEFDDFDSFFDDLLGVKDKGQGSRGKHEQSKVPERQKSPFTILETDFDDYNAAENEFHEYDDFDYFDGLLFDDEKTKKNKKNQKPATDFGLEEYDEYGDDEYDEYDEPNHLPTFDFEPEFSHRPVNYIKPAFFEPPSSTRIHHKVPHRRPHDVNQHAHDFGHNPHVQKPYPDIFKFNHHPDHFQLTRRPQKPNSHQFESNHLPPHDFHPNHRPSQPNHFEGNSQQFGSTPHKPKRPGSNSLVPSHQNEFDIPEPENHMKLPQGFNPNHFNPPLKGYRPPLVNIQVNHEALPEQQFDPPSDEYSNQDDYQNPQDQSDNYGQKLTDHVASLKPTHEVQNHIVEHNEKPQLETQSPPNIHPQLPQLPQFPEGSPFGFTPTPIILEGRPPPEEVQLNEVLNSGFDFKGAVSPASSGEGCHTDKGAFHFPGRKWALEGECGQGVCSRSLSGGWEVWEQRCEGSIQNPQYACVVETKSHLPFPKCCPQPTECRDKV
ncbi:uncharacterized protein LOC131876983 [Tigriopus californicus]|uniref:uncharacterized protein LOC131876983 n=1 Tax=Tigriopus californicus TaxID=6832 RepID=UPI0027D9DB3C|nr:uncharacterized protein LOC131876983 [Tigriopus californicus]